MFQYGIDKVRGGTYTQAHLSRETVKDISARLFHTSCGCITCGRSSHLKKQCNAMNDIEGNFIQERRKSAFDDRSNNKRRRCAYNEVELVHPSSFCVGSSMNY
mmetsp:Transcript_9572/g.14083  ORF Transcript_9572/g.14083 Transcript_9572/m.14083 type:complete len:103 (+) Transcript_9572:2-310(+)